MDESVGEGWGVVWEGGLDLAEAAFWAASRPAWRMAVVRGVGEAAEAVEVVETGLEGV